MRSGWTAVAGLVVAATGAVCHADAQDEEIGKAHFQTGLSYYDSNRFAPAAKEFLEAYRLTHRAALLYNVARAYEKLDDAGRASEYYRRYLVALPTSPERGKIQNVLARFAPRVATLTLHTGAAGGEVLIDEELIGLAPIDPQLLNEGRHHIEVRHPGMVAAVADVALQGGRPTVLTLEPTAGAMIAPPSPRPVEARLAPAGPLMPPESLLSTVKPAEPPPRRRWLWPVVGVGAAVVIAIVVVAIVAATTGTDFSASARNSCQQSCVLFDRPQ